MKDSKISFISFRFLSIFYYYINFFIVVQKNQLIFNSENKQVIVTKFKYIFFSNLNIFLSKNTSYEIVGLIGCVVTLEKLILRLTFFLFSKFLTLNSFLKTIMVVS